MIKYQVDQIISGVVINIFALGLTSFMATRVLGPNPQFNSPDRFTTISIPLLEDIPVIGAMFFDGNMFLYGSLLLVAFLHYALFYTRWGLRSRSVGEHPKAADTVGIDVYKTRYRNVTLAGLIAGFGGAALTLGSTGRFEENMTAGVGYIGLAAMIAGRWRPFGVLGAALVFGFARAMQQKLGILGHADPVGVPCDGAVHPDDRRGRRTRRQGTSPGRRRPALHQGLAATCRTRGPRCTRWGTVGECRSISLAPP